MADELIIEFALQAWIEAQSESTALGVKVYPWADAPQGAATSKPFVLYHRIAGGRLRSLGGPSGVGHPRIQLDFVGRNYLILRRYASAIRAKLEALPQGATMSGRTVQVVMVNDEMDATDADVEPAHGDAKAEHRITLDLTIWFVEG